MSKSKASQGQHRIVLSLDNEQLDELLCQIESTMPSVGADTRSIDSLNHATGRVLAELQQTQRRQYDDEESRRLDLHQSVAQLRLAPVYGQLVRHWSGKPQRWGCSSSPKVTARLRRRLLEGLSSNGLRPVPTQLPALPSKSVIQAEHAAVEKLTQLSTERAGLLTRRSALAVKCLAARRRILTARELREFEQIEARYATVQRQLQAGIPIQGTARAIHAA